MDETTLPAGRIDRGKSLSDRLRLAIDRLTDAPTEVAGNASPIDGLANPTPGVSGSEHPSTEVARDPTAPSTQEA
jgi:hypothetical protein